MNGEYKELRALVQRVLEGAEAELAMLALEAENVELLERFRCDPGLAVTGELFQAADALSEQGKLLALYFASLGESHLEERAWGLRYEPIRTAYPYKRNMLGPVVLDWANCNKRIGDLQKADALYEKIVSDLQDILPWGPTFNADWILSIRCLFEAVNESSVQRSELSERIALVLRESEEMQNKENERLAQELAAHHKLPAL